MSASVADSMAGSVTALFKQLAIAVGLIGGMIFAISWGVNAWQSSNPHETHTYIEANPSWMDGEIRPCSSFPVNKPMMGNPAGYAFGSLRCGDGNDIYRQFPVTFYGREIQPEYSQITWECSRHQDGFVCREMGGTSH